MRLTELVATGELVRVNGVQARVWIGQSLTGERVHLFVCAVAIPTADGESIVLAEKELIERKLDWQEEGDEMSRWVGCVLLATYGVGFHVACSSRENSPTRAASGAAAEGGRHSMGVGGASGAPPIVVDSAGSAGETTALGTGGAGSAAEGGSAGAELTGGSGGAGGDTSSSLPMAGNVGTAAGGVGGAGELFSQAIEATEAGCVVVRLVEPGKVFVRPAMSDRVLQSFSDVREVWFATEEKQRYEIDSTTAVADAYVVMVPREPEISADGMHGSAFLFAGYRDGEAPANVAALWALKHVPPNGAETGTLKITITPPSDMRSQLELLGDDETPVDGATAFHGVPGAQLSLIKGKLRGGDYLVRVSNWGPDALPLGGEGELPPYVTTPYQLEWISK